MRSFLMIPTVLVVHMAMAQRDFEPRIVGGLGIGLQQPDVVGGTLGNERAIPWVGGQLELGGSLIYRDRVGIAAVGGFNINGYLLWPVDSVCYDLYHTTTRAEFRTWWQLHGMCADCPSSGTIGIAAGWTFQNADVLTTTEQSFTSVTTAPAMVRPYIAPEIGLINDDDLHRYQVSVRYLIHLDAAPAWTNVATSPMGEATYQASDNYLGVVMRYHIGFKERERKPLPPPDVDHHMRLNDTLTTMSTRKQFITLRLWDNAEVDGDTISVLFNDRTMLLAHALTKKPVRVRLETTPGRNTLLIVAHNEGRVAPNTASGTLQRGSGKEELLIRTSQRTNQVVMIERE